MKDAQGRGIRHNGVTKAKVQVWPKNGLRLSRVSFLAMWSTPFWAHDEERMGYQAGRTRTMPGP